MHNGTNIESTRFSYSNKKHCFMCFRECKKYYMISNSKFGRTIFELFVSKCDKSAVAQFLAVTGYSQNYETTKQIIKVLNPDFFSPILTIILIVTSISIVLFLLPLFLSLLHVIILLILLFWSSNFYFLSRSVLIHSCHHSCPSSSPPLLDSFSAFHFPFICFLNSLVFLQFVYVSSSHFLVHFSLSIPVVYITFDTPSTPP
jgi:hypothetical protein